MDNNALVTTLPPGRYFIGDPCYVIVDEDWPSFCDVSFDANGPGKGDGVLEFDGHLMLAGGTAFGDGEFMDQQCNVYGVDAGMLGIIPEALWDPKIVVDELYRLGNVVTITEPFTAEVSDGVFSLGGYVIDTNGTSDEDDVDSSDEDE